MLAANVEWPGPYLGCLVENVAVRLKGALMLMAQPSR